MNFYISLAVIYVVNSVIEQRAGKIRLHQSKSMTIRRWIGVFDAVLLAIVSDFRSTSVGADLVSYARWYKEYAAETLFQTISTRPTGFTYHLLNKIALFMGLDFHGYMALHSLICIGILWYLLDSFSENISLGFYFYIATGRLQYLFSLLRMELAVLLLGLAVACVIKKCKKRAIIWWILAVGAHASAIVGVVLLMSAKMKKKSSFCMLIICLMIGIAFGCLLGFDYVFNWYSAIRGTRAYERQFNGGLNYLLLLVAVNTVCLLILHTRGKVSQCAYENIDTIFMHLALLASVFQILAFYSSILTRITYYFTFYYILLLPNILCRTRQRTNFAVYKYSFIATWMVIMVVMMAGDSQSIIPYSIYLGK